MHKTQVDITPHPRILQVLGEIEFKPWQCVAELVDNSVDSFLNMKRAGTPINNPAVQIGFGRDTVVVNDNGPGMSIDELEMAVKAGWTSQEMFGSLGLYGIGFNIATARLGSMTTIWTTRMDDEQWYGLEIDLKKMARGGTYTLNVKTRAKADPRTSGTHVEVANVRSDWKDRFLDTSWLRVNVTERLARIYGTMLREADAYPIKFSLHVNTKRVQAWEHCYWPAEELVYRPKENFVSPIQTIDIVFGKRYVNRLTGEPLNSIDGLPEDEYIEVPERVSGWLGIQRYADEKDFGIDILRNGRKIEVGCKDIFLWDEETEYPIDDPRNRGRIVGEIHLDHGYVHYTKHRFEREHQSWQQLLSAVRNNEPLTKRSERGFEGVNTSPLGSLFRTFRRNSPMKGSKQTWKDILFIKENDKAKKWAELYRKNILEYRDYEKWTKELDANSLSEQAPNTGSSGGNQSGDQSSDAEATGTSQGDDIIMGGGIGQDTNAGQGGVADFSVNSADINQKQRIPIHELNLHITGIGASGNAYDFEVYSVETSGDSIPLAWVSRATARGVYEIEVDPDHPAFNSTSLQVRDAVLAEVAHIITSEEIAKAGALGVVCYGDVLTKLRDRYASTDSLDIGQLRKEIDEIRERITSCLSQELSEQLKRDLISLLQPEDAQRVQLAYASGPEDASPTDYLEMRHIAAFLQSRPAILFEANCFNRPWSPARLADNSTLLEEHRKRLANELWMPVTQLGEFTTQLTTIMTRPYLALIRACINQTKEYLA